MESRIRAQVVPGPRRSPQAAAGPVGVVALGGAEGRRPVRGVVHQQRGDVAQLAGVAGYVELQQVATGAPLDVGAHGGEDRRP